MGRPVLLSRAASFTRSFIHSFSRSQISASPSTSAPPATPPPARGDKGARGRRRGCGGGASAPGRPGARARQTPEARRGHRVEGVALVGRRAAVPSLSYLGNSGRGWPDVTGGAPPHCGTGLVDSARRQRTGRPSCCLPRPGLGAASRFAPPPVVPFREYPAGALRRGRRPARSPGAATGLPETVRCL